MRVDWPEVVDGVRPHQAEQLTKACAGPVGILGGTPGTGKSFTAAALARAIVEQHGLASLGVAAPTGKAAVRITDAMQRNNVPVLATTIHRALGVQRNGRDGKGWCFAYGELNPLPQRFWFLEECFLAGTFVDTPTGPRAIESMAAGELILNARGVDSVAATFKKVATSVVVTKCGTTETFSSPSHRFLTARGWVRADDLRPGDSLVQTDFAMRLLWGTVCGEQGGEAAEVLLDLLQHEMVDAAGRVQGQDPYAGTERQARGRAESILAVRRSGCDQAGRSNPPPESNVVACVAGKGIASLAGDWSQAKSAGWKRQGDDESTVALGGGVGSRLDDRGCHPHGLGPEKPGVALHNRHCQSRENDCDRGGRTVASCDQDSGARQEAGCLPGFRRVDSAEVLEPRDHRLDRFRDADGKLYLYDLQATRHRTYSVNGHCVHNCSMLDTDLAASFFAAMAPGTHVLLIGDIGQLPPVGHGAPLRDLIAAGLPYGELTEVHRNAGDIVHVCKAIRAGRRFVPSPSVDVEAGWNLAHVPASNATEAAWRLERLLRNPPPGLDPVWDVQILVTVNEKSDLSRAALNKKLQGVLNSPRPGARPSDKFRDGDKVICTSNGMRLKCSPFADIDSIPKAEADEFVANGEIGRASQVQAKKMLVSFTAPERTVLVSGEGMGDFDLAYAVTVHKSQGSQWPVVVYMVDDYPGARFIGCRELTYTAISRAEKLAVCIGRQGVLDVDCARVALTGRKTFLKELLDEAA